MIASAITINSETIKELDRPISKSRKCELRMALIIDYIKSRPMGERIKLVDFAKIAKFNGDNAVHAFLSNMIRKGYVEREALGPKQYCYSIPGHGQVKIIKAAVPRFTREELENKAMEFSWKNADRHDSLRAFLTWIKQP